MNSGILDKINSKIEIQLKDPSTIEKAIDMLLVLKSCYKSEYNSVTQDIQKVLNSKSKQYFSVLDNMESLSLGLGKVMIDGKETKLISIERLTEIFSSEKYSSIKLAFCLQPENLILLSLEKEMTSEVIK